MSREVTEAVVAKVETPAEIVKEKAIQKEVSLVEIQAKEMVITSEEEYEKAAEFGKQIKEKAKVVTDFFKPMKDSAYQAHKAVCDREKTMLKPLQEAERILKKSMSAYYQEQERKRRKLEEKMRREAEAERERKLNEAAALEAAGKADEAEAALMDAQVVESVASRATVVMNVPKTKGVSNSKDWEIESIDHEKVPIMFSGMTIRPVDEKAVMRLIRASKGTIQIPGIRYKETIKVSIRR